MAKKHLTICDGCMAEIRFYQGATIKITEHTTIGDNRRVFPARCIGTEVELDFCDKCYELLAPKLVELVEPRHITHGM